MSRVTRENIDQRVGNLNHRMEERGSIVRYAAQGDRYHACERGQVLKHEAWTMQSTVTTGTKREVGDFLHAMMVALDDAGSLA